MALCVVATLAAFALVIDPDQSSNVGDSRDMHGIAPILIHTRNIHTRNIHTRNTGDMFPLLANGGIEEHRSLFSIPCFTLRVSLPVNSPRSVRIIDRSLT